MPGVLLLYINRGGEIKRSEIVNAPTISEEDRKIRTDSWKRIREILEDKSLAPAEKLALCLNVSNLYAALTGDDSLFPPRVRDEHAKMLEWVKKNVEKIEKRKAALERDAKTGQAMLC